MTGADSPQQPGTTFLEALLAMDRIATNRILLSFVEQYDPFSAIEQLVVPALEQIGNQWETGELSLSQVYMSGRICEEIVDTLLPASGDQRIDQPVMAIAVLEDYHLLGKRMVYSTLRASGYALYDYGRVDTATLVEKVIGDQIAILLISVLMLPSALRIYDVRQKLTQAGYYPRIVVGGAPFRFDQQLWQDVGADRMGDTASDVVTILHDLM